MNTVIDYLAPQLVYEYTECSKLESPLNYNRFTKVLGMFFSMQKSNQTA